MILASSGPRLLGVFQGPWFVPLKCCLTAVDAVAGPGRAGPFPSAGPGRAGSLTTKSQSGQNTLPQSRSVYSLYYPPLRFSSWPFSFEKKISFKFHRHSECHQKKQPPPRPVRGKQIRRSSGPLRTRTLQLIATHNASRAELSAQCNDKLLTARCTYIILMMFMQIVRNTSCLYLH